MIRTNHTVFGRRVLVSSTDMIPDHNSKLALVSIENIVHLTVVSASDIIRIRNCQQGVLLYRVLAQQLPQFCHLWCSVCLLVWDTSGTCPSHS